MAITCEFTIDLEIGDPEADIATCTRDATTVEFVQSETDPPHYSMLCPDHARESMRLHNQQDDDYPFEYTITQHLVLEYTAPYNLVTRVLGIAGESVVAYAIGGGVGVRLLRRVDQALEEWEAYGPVLDPHDSGYVEALRQRISDHVAANPHGSADRGDIFAESIDDHGPFLSEGGPITCDECGLPITEEMGDDTCECA